MASVQKQDTVRFKTEQASRRKQVAALWAMKMSQEDIATTLQAQGFQVSQPTVSRDVKHILRQIIKDTSSDMENFRARELASLDRLELEANSLFQKVKGKDNKKEALKAIDTILKIQARRASLLGLDRPEKLDLKAEHSGQIVVNLVRASCRIEGSGDSTSV
jgi:hypothetical protein